MTIKELDEKMYELGFTLPVYTNPISKHYNYANMSGRHSVVIKFDDELNDWTIASYVITNRPLCDGKELTTKQMYCLLEIIKELPNIEE